MMYIKYKVGYQFIPGFGCEFGWNVPLTRKEKANRRVFQRHANTLATLAGELPEMDISRAAVLCHCMVDGDVSLKRLDRTSYLN